MARILQTRYQQILSRGQEHTSVSYQRDIVLKDEGVLSPVIPLWVSLRRAASQILPSKWNAPMTPNRASEQTEKAAVEEAAMLFWGFSVKDVRAKVQVNGKADYAAFSETPKGEQHMHFSVKVFMVRDTRIL